MNLIIDIGNSFVKTAVFNNNDIIEFNQNIKHETIEQHVALLHKKHPTIENAIISTVALLPQRVLKNFKRMHKVFISANYKTPVPIANNYDSPKTLGFDRLAAAVGANNIYPNRNVVIFDAGTAFTVEVVNENNVYCGGSISPGMAMRFKALNKFTDKLPLLKAKHEVLTIGTNTNDAIWAGVLNSMVYEIKGYIDHFNKKLNKPIFVFTGGDTFFFVKILKNYIFAQPKLVLIGLNRILNYNVEKN